MSVEIFALFHLGTSRAFSAIQRHRFVHGHVHILIPMAWEDPFSLIFAFSTWGLLVPSAQFSAISLSMGNLIFFCSLGYFGDDFGVIFGPSWCKNRCGGVMEALLSSKFDFLFKTLAILEAFGDHL